MKQNSILISVIIPVYNVEKYLNECIDSVINSTYKDLEIILVDDGSSDNCPQICDKYACMDNRIKVIHKENEGLSSARNEGINIANGDYISFIDSDDYISTNLYEIAVDIINEQNCDIFSFGYYLKYGNKNKFKLKPNTFLVLKPYEAIEKLNLFDYMGVSSWNKIFKKSLFSNIRFPVGALSEDNFTIYKLFDNANSIIYDSIPLYYYRQRKNSITTKTSFVNDFPIRADFEMLSFVEENYPQIILSAKSRFVFDSIGVYNCYLTNTTSLKDYKNIIFDSIMIYYKDLIKYVELPISRRIQLFIFKNFNLLYNFIIILYRKIKLLRIIKNDIY
ncbi:MAG: glycosyltransferase family 2 protein [Clostridia bacterium]|nr:glycosyltransferase family 2 protein [Clostridia bacterium]